jgi:hypothetical protein
VILGWLAVYDDAKTERAAGIGRKERGFKRIYVISEATATTPWKSPHGSLNRRADFHLEDLI